MRRARGDAQGRRLTYNFPRHLELREAVQRPYVWSGTKEIELRLISAIATTIAVLFCFSVLQAESVYVKYGGDVDLRFFECWEITRSSFIKRVCYDRRNEYMLISLNGTFYHYCEIDAGTVSSLLSAPSMRSFYSGNIKGHFD